MPNYWWGDGEIQGSQFCSTIYSMQANKKGSREIWMRYEPNGYTHDYRLYLGKFDEMQGQNLGERELWYICARISNGKVIISFLTVHCMENYGIYACGTIKTNRRGFPTELKNPNLERGDANQVQHENTVITFRTDNKPVHVSSTTSNPLGDEPAIWHRRGGDLVVLQRPPPIQHYQHNYSGVDRSQQYNQRVLLEDPQKNSGSTLWTSNLKSL